MNYLGVTDRVLEKFTMDSVEGILMTEPNENPDPLRLNLLGKDQRKPLTIFTKGRNHD